MPSYRQIPCHIVFRTKESRSCLSLEQIPYLFAHIHGIIKKKNGFLYRIKRLEEHIHILSDLHPSIALADYLRGIKTTSSIWLKGNRNFPQFEAWADGYAALT